MLRLLAVALATSFLIALPNAAHAAGGISLVPEIEILALNFVVLGLLIYPVNKLLIQPLIALLAEREKRSAGATDRVAELAGDSNALQETLDGRLVETRGTAQARRGEILSTAQEDERRVLEAARADAAEQVESVRASIAAELETARAILQVDARELAREAAASILGRAV
jgi:F0F1-type ATP synthase membrane subunit b/b'